MKAIKNADLAMILLDVTNNRPILDGTTVFLGDQVLIDIKAPIKGESVCSKNPKFLPTIVDMIEWSSESGITIHVENCSVSALTSAEDIMQEKVDILKKGCPVRNDMVTFNLNFRRISETHVESNVFEVFKLRSSSLMLMNCWVQICAQKNKCLQRVCTPEVSTPKNVNLQNAGRQASLFGRSAFDFLTAGEDEEDAGGDKDEFYSFKDAGVRINIEDPYGVQQSLGRSLKNENFLPNVIGTL